MVGVARIELATPAMSTQCSTTELHAHTFRGDAPLIAPARLGKPFARTIPLLLVRPVGAAEQRVDLAPQILEVKGLRQQLGLRHILLGAPGRSEERRVGTACVSTFRARWCPSQ